MVKYGDSDFQNWANELGLDDNDVELARKTSKKHAITYFLIYFLGGAIGICTGLLMEQTSSKSMELVLMILYGLSAVCAFSFYFTLPLFLEAWAFSKWMKQRSFNAKPGFLWVLFYICLFFLFFSIIPFIIWRLAKKRLWGTGFRKLMKKGLIGNH